MYEGINAGILPFSSASEFDEIYERVLPSKMDPSNGFNPYFKNGNWFAAAIKRRRRAEIKALRTISVGTSCTLDLPIELLLEIFEFLHPIDLYSVIRSTKRMRSILLDRRASSVWKEAFKRCADVLPPCPLDISEPRWASMLFGPATCDYCGRKGAMIDFHFRCRFCQFCMNDMYIWKSGYSVNCLGIGEDLDAFWKCLPSSYRQDSGFYPNVWDYGHGPRYLKWDIGKMIERFIIFNSSISSGIPGASLEFEAFKSLEIANAIRGLKESMGANAFMDQMTKEVTKEHKDIMKQLIKRHASVLLRRGHDQVDLDIASGELLAQYLRRKRFKFNYRSYKQLALELLRTSDTHKVDRLEKQRQFLIVERREFVGDRYRTYQKTLPPTSWPNFPGVKVIYEHEPFAAFIASESRKVGELPEELVQSHLAPFLDSWMQAHESDIYARLESPYENLDLAVNVFVCAYCDDHWTRRPFSILIGLKDLRSHFKCVNPQFEFRFSSAGRASALALINLLGMDPKTATVNDLDARDARFFCEKCNVSWTQGMLRRQALTWRECISHVLQMKDRDSHHSIPSWALLTAEATECIRRREEPFPKPEDRVWCCNHCPEHYDDATTKAKALRHAKDEHSIYRPRVDVDVICERRKLSCYSPRKPICVGLEPPETYQCRNCPDTTINRLWQIDSLKHHIVDKHRIMNPGPGDWIVVKIVDRSVGPHSEAITYPQNVEEEKGGLD